MILELSLGTPKRSKPWSRIWLIFQATSQIIVKGNWNNNTLRCRSSQGPNSKEIGAQIHRSVESVRAGDTWLYLGYFTVTPQYRTRRQRQHPLTNCLIVTYLILRKTLNFLNSLSVSFYHTLTACRSNQAMHMLLFDHLSTSLLLLPMEPAYP